MNNKRWYCAMIICFVSIISKGITLDWAKHNASDSILEYDLKRINVRSCALDNPLIELINRVALSKHFMNFSIQFVRTDIFDDPLVLIADECTSSIFEKRKEFVGVFIANNSYNYFVKADSGMLWRQYFKYAEDEERIEFRQIHVPDSVYIVLPDIRSVCLAKIGEKSCKILYCEIDGKVQEEDEKFMELFQYTHYMSCHFSHLFVTDGTGVQPHKYGAKELDRENGLDLYDSHARWYDPLLARTTTQDPLAEKYRHLSPYLWCAGNPIALVDPTGMYFNSADSAQAFEFIALLNKRIDDLSSSDIKDKQEQLNEINQSIQDIELMRKDANTRYSFNLVECEPETVQLPDGTISMNIDIKMDGNFAHEIRHGGQLARGEFGYVNGNPDNRYGASHEVDAYKAQLSACGHLTYMPNIDESDIKSLLLLRLYGQRALWKTVTDIKQINTKLLKSMYEGPGIRLTQLYPIKRYGKEWYKR